MLADHDPTQVDVPSEWPPTCLNEAMADIANRQAGARLDANPDLQWFGLEGGHIYAAQFRREAERMHASHPRTDRTWF